MHAIITSVSQHLHTLSDKVDSWKPLIGFVAVKLFVLMVTFPWEQMDHAVGIAGGLITGSWGLYCFWEKLSKKRKKEEPEEKEEE